MPGRGDYVARSRTRRGEAHSGGSTQMFSSTAAPSRSPPDQPDKAGDEEAESKQPNELSYPWRAQPFRADAFRLAALHKSNGGNADPEKTFAADKAAAKENAALAIIRSLGFRFGAALEEAPQQPADVKRRHRRHRKVNADRKWQRGNLQ